MGFKRAEEIKDAGFINLLKLSKEERLNQFKNEGFSKNLIASNLLR